MKKLQDLSKSVEKYQKNKKKIILFSNDPGGAQVLSSYFFSQK